MKVAIDTSPLSSAHAVRGVGSYTRNLVEVLKNRKNVRLVDSVKEADIIHYPYFDLFFLTLPLAKPKPTVVTIHDVIPLLYPEHYQTGIRGWLKFQIQKFSLKGVGAIITDSESSKKDIVRFLDVPPEKIYPIPLSPHPIFKKMGRITPLCKGVRQKYNLPKSFVLYVGDVNYNKNIEGLIKAFALLTSSSKLKAQNSKLQLKTKNLGLALVGRAFKEKNLLEVRAVRQLIETLNLTYRVIMPGFVPAEGLVAFYNLATVYCQPSFYEGFGLPVLEAMSCGCPVVAAKTQTLVEIAGNVALLVDPKDPKSIAEGLFRVLTDKELRSGLVEKGLAHVQGFSWEKTARATLEVYRKAAHG